MSWNRALVAPALADVLQTTASAAGDTVAIFDHQPTSLNPPALVVGRPSDVTFAVFSFGTDLATLPVMCVAGADEENRAAELVELVRLAVTEQPSLAGVVQECTATAERNWRNNTLGGVELVLVDCVLTITM